MSREYNIARAHARDSHYERLRSRIRNRDRGTLHKGPLCDRDARRHGRYYSPLPSPLSRIRIRLMLYPSADGCADTFCCRPEEDSITGRSAVISSLFPVRGGRPSGLLSPGNKRATTSRSLAISRDRSLDLSPRKMRRVRLRRRILFPEETFFFFTIWYIWPR